MDARGVEGREVLMGLKHRCCGHADKKEGKRMWLFFRLYAGHAMPRIKSKSPDSVFLQDPSLPQSPPRELWESQGHFSSAQRIHSGGSLPISPSPAREKLTLAMYVHSEGPVAHEAQRGLR